MSSRLENHPARRLGVEVDPCLNRREVAPGTCCEGIRRRRECRELAQGPLGGRHQQPLAPFLRGQCEFRSDPLRGVGFTANEARGILCGRNRDVEVRVIAAQLEVGGNPARPRSQQTRLRDGVVSGQHLIKGRPMIYQRESVSLKRRDVEASARREQDTALLKRLPDRRERVGLQVIAPDLVSGIDHSARKDIHATGKEHPDVAPEHEDLELLDPVAQQDHRR